MTVPDLVRRVLQSPPSTPVHGGAILSSFITHQRRSHASTSHAEREHSESSSSKGSSDKIRGNWFTLPPFAFSVDGAALGRELSHGKAGGGATTTALKWVIKCCPELPRSLVQKLFRLRQVRRESLMGCTDASTQTAGSRLKRVAAKDLINLGDRICLPITVKELPSKKPACGCNLEEVNFVQDLVLHKDVAILAMNKPPGMPVQGGIGIRRSLDELAVTCLKYDYSENPRLVHRLDRDCSGILVMGRTQTSATFLHSIFREKTVGVLNNVGKDSANKKRILQRRYWALVIGSPRRPEGVISAPLGKVLVDNGKSDRITIFNSAQAVSSQHAITEYRVIGSHHGYTWLELSPITGRKHQLRVHCAEVLGTPIVGDLKYGWQAHRKWKHLQRPSSESDLAGMLEGKALPFGLDLDSGSISDQQPRLHLHCQHVILPDVAQALQNKQLSSGRDLVDIETLELVAPLPPYMQESLDILQNEDLNQSG